MLFWSSNDKRSICRNDKPSDKKMTNQVLSNCKLTQQSHNTTQHNVTQSHNKLCQIGSSHNNQPSSSFFFSNLSHTGLSRTKPFSSPKFCGQAVIHSSFVVVCLEIHSIHLRHNPLTPPLTPLLGCP